MSHCQTCALPPAREIADAVACKCLSVRPHKTTFAPREASFSAMAEPMPRPAPVTTAVCPERALSPIKIQPCPTDNYAEIITLTNFSIKQSRALERTNLLKFNCIHIIPLTGEKFPPRWAEEAPSFPAVSREGATQRPSAFWIRTRRPAGTLKSVEFPGALGAME